MDVSRWSSLLSNTVELWLSYQLWSARIPADHALLALCYPHLSGATSHSSYRTRNSAWCYLGPLFYTSRYGRNMTAQHLGPTSAHNSSQCVLHVLAEASGRCRLILGGWWRLYGQQTKAKTFLYCPEPWQCLKNLIVCSHTRNVPGIRPNSYLRDRFGKAIIFLQKQMISLAPSSSCANWLIMRPVICNQYYLLASTSPKANIYGHIWERAHFLNQEPCMKYWAKWFLGHWWQIVLFWSGRSGGENRQMPDQDPDVHEIATTTGTDPEEQILHTKRCFVYREACHRTFFFFIMVKKY